MSFVSLPVLLVARMPCQSRRRVHAGQVLTIIVVMSNSNSRTGVHRVAHPHRGSQRANQAHTSYTLVDIVSNFISRTDAGKLAMHPTLALPHSKRATATAPGCRRNAEVTGLLRNGLHDFIVLVLQSVMILVKLALPPFVFDELHKLLSMLFLHEEATFGGVLHACAPTHRTAPAPAKRQTSTQHRPAGSKRREATPHAAPVISALAHATDARAASAGRSCRTKHHGRKNPPSKAPSASRHSRLGYPSDWKCTHTHTVFERRAGGQPTQ